MPIRCYTLRSHSSTTDRMTDIRRPCRIQANGAASYDEVLLSNAANNVTGPIFSNACLSDCGLLQSVFDTAPLQSLQTTIATNDIVVLSSDEFGLWLIFFVYYCSHSLLLDQELIPYYYSSCCCPSRSCAPLIDANLLEEQSCQISSRSDLKRRSLRFFEEVAQQEEQQKQQQREQRHGISF